MIAAAPLSPAETLVLLEPDAKKGREAVKVSLLHLVMRGLVRLRQEERKGFFGRCSTVTCLASGTAAPDPAEAVPLLAVIRAAEAKGGTMAEFVNEAQREYGSDLDGFRRRHVLPALLGRGLVEERRERWLGLFNRTRLRHTPAGAAEKARIEGLMEQGRTIPALLAQNPAQALAIAVALGSAILLVPELRPVYEELHRRLQASSGLDSAGDGGSADFNWLGGATTGEGGDLDFGDFDAFTSSLDAFDSAFDSAASDAGADGGDGGGGDGGGGGD